MAVKWYVVFCALGETLRTARKLQLKFVVATEENIMLLRYLEGQEKRPEAGVLLEMR